MICLPHRVHRALVKRLTALSTIAAPSAGTLTKNVHTFLKCAGARGSERGECSLAAIAALLTRGEHCGVTLQLSF